MAFSFGGPGFNPPWGQMVSSKDTSMSLSDCVKLATSKLVKICNSDLKNKEKIAKKSKFQIHTEFEPV